MGKKTKEESNINEGEKVSIRLSAELKEDLDAYCEENGIKRSVFLRDAVCSMLYGVESKMSVPTVNINDQIQKEKKEIEQLKAYLELLTLKEEKTKLMEQIAKKTNSAAFGDK